MEAALNMAARKCQQAAKAAHWQKLTGGHKWRALLLGAEEETKWEAAAALLASAAAVAHADDGYRRVSADFSFSPCTMCAPLISA